MKSMEWKLSGSGKRILVNLESIDAVMEANDKTVLCINSEEFHVSSSYDEVLKHIPSE